MNRTNDDVSVAAHRMAVAGIRKGRIGRWFLVWAALAVTLIGMRLIIAGTNRQSGPDGRIKSLTVTPPVPSKESVEELRAKRAAEMQRERERQQLEREKRQLELEKEKLRADVASRVAKYQGDVKAIAEKYRKMLPLSEAEECFGRAEEGTRFVASSDGLCGFSACGKLAYKMAYDKIKGTHRAEEAINPIVCARVVAPIEDAVKCYEKWTTDFRLELQKEEKAFALDLALRSQKFAETVSCFKATDASEVSAAVDKLVGGALNHAKESAFAAAGTLVELAMIKSSYAAIRTVTVRIAGVALAGVAKKLATTASAAVVSAAADGPLPIGDAVAAVIAVGGLGWTAYDIHKVCKTMPQDMREGMMKAIDETRTALRQTAEGNLNADRDTCLRAADVRAKELDEMINK